MLLEATVSPFPDIPCICDASNEDVNTASRFSECASMKYASIKILMNTRNAEPDSISARAVFTEGCADRARNRRHHRSRRHAETAWWTWSPVQPIGAADTTVLVILPGLDGTGSMHEDFVHALGTTFERVGIVAYPAHAPLDYIALEALVRARLPIDRPFVLLGESLSGPIAFAIAAKPLSSMPIGVVLTTSSNFALDAARWLRAPHCRCRPLAAALIALHTRVAQHNFERHLPACDTAP